MQATSEIFEKILEELLEIKKLLLLNLKETFKKELNDIATTIERRQIWGIMNGLISTTEIAEKVGVSPRTFKIFVSQLEEKDLVITEKHGYPKRRIDYISSDWQFKEVSRFG